MQYSDNNYLSGFLEQMYFIAQRMYLATGKSIHIQTFMYISHMVIGSSDGSN